MKLLFKQGPSLGSRFLMLALLSLLLMVLDHRFNTITAVRSTLSLAIDPLRYLVNLPAEIMDWSSGMFTSNSDLSLENERLRTQNQFLQARLQTFASLKAEIANLRALLKSIEEHEGHLDRVLVAKILSVDADPYRRQILLNKGSNDQVYAGQPIVGAAGVVGKVVHVGPLTSTALQITDASHSLPVQVIRNGVRAIAVGNPKNNMLSLLHQPNNADIRVGDELVTSGLGCLFPSGFPAGRVIDIHIDPKLPFARVDVEPSELLDRNREVLLTWPSMRQLQNINSDCAPITKDKR